MSWDDVQANGTATTSSAEKVVVSQSAVDYDFFSVYGLKPIVGRFFSRNHGGDAASTDDAVPFHAPLVINVAASKAFGFSSPAQAIGKTVTISMGANPQPSEIIGVVQDFSLNTVRSLPPPTVFFVKKNMLDLMSIKLTGQSIPETLKAIERAWSDAGIDSGFSIEPVDQYLREKFADMTRLSKLLVMLAALAITVASLGLLALAAFTAEQRTKEIGIRKAMGAETRDIVFLLVKRFTKPVLLANIIAWPIAFFCMNHWLTGFASHVDLRLWMFLSAGGVALMVAWVTVGLHALLVARTKPATALRYE